MTQFELLSLHETLMRVMNANGIKTKDIELMNLYRDAEQMDNEHLQKSYIVQVLADKYKMSVRSVYTTLDKFKTEIVIF